VNWAPRCHDNRHGNTGCYPAIPLKARLERCFSGYFQTWWPLNGLLTSEVREWYDVSWDEGGEVYGCRASLARWFVPPS
jgi:hypothetical protein